MNKTANALDLLPKEETLASYMKRIRELRGFTRTELANLAAVNVSTVARIEGGTTGAQKPRKEIQERLSAALQIPIEYLQAASREKSVEVLQTNKVCLSCWMPGKPPDSRWSMLDAKFCLRCGERLKDKCDQCSEPVLLRARFCPQCGMPYTRKNTG
jgi:transcriptional regulator with XRE-family HTH domain